MFDLTGRSDAAHLIDPIRLIDNVASRLGVEYLIVGAAARDLILHFGYGLEIRRATADLDIGVAVKDWDAYEALRTAFPHVIGEPTHRVRVNHSLIDLVPFGGVERADRTIAWPPGHDAIMSAFGMTEALASAVTIRFDSTTACRAASLPAQVILKFMAWHERGVALPRRDGVDIQLIMKSYSATWNVDRMYEGDGVALLQRVDYDLELAGAMLLGIDVRALLAPDDVRRFQVVVTGSLRESGGLPDDMPHDRHRNELLLRAFSDGLAG